MQLDALSVIFRVAALCSFAQRATLARPRRTRRIIHGMSDQNKNTRGQGYGHLSEAPMPVLIASGKRLLVDYANEKALDLMHRQPGEVVGSHLHDLLPDIFSCALIEDIYSKCIIEGTGHTLRESQVKVLDGQRLKILWYNITISPLRDEAGLTTGVILFFSNITDGLETRGAPGQHEQYLSRVFRKAPIGLVWYRGPEFIVDMANDRALEMWGKTREDVIGKRIDEVFPEVATDPKIKARHSESIERLKRGETHIVDEVELTFLRDGVPHTGWYSYIHEPYTDPAGTIIGMMAVAIEVTDQVLSRKKLQIVTDALPSLISYVNRKEQYEFVNKAYEIWFGRTKADFVGRSIKDALGKSAYDKVKPHVDRALAGSIDTYESWIPYRDGGRKFVSANYIPHIDANGNVLGYIALVTDLTERKNHEDALSQQQERLRLIVEGISAGTFEYDLATGSIQCSNEMKSLLGIPADDTIDREAVRAVVHADDFQLLLEQANRLQDEVHGYIAADYRIVKKDTGQVRWLYSRAKMQFHESQGKMLPVRIIGFSIDITDRKVSEERLREFNQKLESEVRERTAELSKTNDLLVGKIAEVSDTQAVLQQLIDSSVEYIAVLDRDLKFLVVNKALEKFINKSRQELLGKHIFEVHAGVRGSGQVASIEKALTGELVHLRANPSISRPNVWFDTHYIPLVINGRVEGVIALSRDISDIVRSEQELANVNRQLAEAQRLAKLGSWEWDVATGNVLWSDEMYRIYGYEEKFPVDFVRATERMSPADAEASSRRIQQHIQRAIDHYKRTGELVFEIPFVEFPIRLPDGTQKLLRNSGKIQLTPEGKLHRIMGAVQDMTLIRSAEEKLRALVSELEMKNKELESFNYVASHDLQEPLRKIQTFIDRIRNGSLDQKTVDDYLLRVNNSARRMHELIQSMLTLSRLSNPTDGFTDVDLNVVLANCKSDFELVIKEKNALIDSDPLPVVVASAFQMGQLFGNLINNALKFSKEHPIINITCQRVTGREMEQFNTDRGKAYWCLSFTDNGIGFESKYKDQIFDLFQRLHPKNEFTGTGIGLSIVKRIVERHRGFIEASSSPGKGARFSVWLPCSSQG